MLTIFRRHLKSCKYRSRRFHRSRFLNYLDVPWSKRLPRRKNRSGKAAIIWCSLSLCDGFVPCGSDAPKYGATPLINGYCLGQDLRVRNSYPVA